MARPREQDRGRPGVQPLSADRNKQKRTQYASDPALRESVQAAGRERYRESNPLPPSRLQRGLLTSGIRREVKAYGAGRSRIIDTYTIPEAAEALGKSLPNFRRWVTGELVPSPILKDTARSYFCYCAEELRIMARVLAEHERQYAYFCQSHQTTSNQIHQLITGHRNMQYGDVPEQTEEQGE